MKAEHPFGADLRDMGRAIGNLLADPVEQAIGEDRARDHALAQLRGERLAHFADDLIDRLRATGQLGAIDRQALRVQIMNVAADLWYGNAAIDLPVAR